MDHPGSAARHAGPARPGVMACNAGAAALQALLAPGDRVVCTVPGYQSLYEVAASLGCEVAPWPLHRWGRLPGRAQAWLPHPRMSLTRLPKGAAWCSRLWRAARLPPTCLSPAPACSCPDGSLAFRLEDAQALIAGAAQPPKMVIVNSPHNPSVGALQRAGGAGGRGRGP